MQTAVSHFIPLVLLCFYAFMFHVPFPFFLLGLMPLLSIFVLALLCFLLLRQDSVCNKKGIGGWFFFFLHLAPFYVFVSFFMFTFLPDYNLSTIHVLPFMLEILCTF